MTREEILIKFKEEELTALEDCVSAMARVMEDHQYEMCLAYERCEKQLKAIGES